jgi:hypothetical protein
MKRLLIFAFFALSCPLWGQCTLPCVVSTYQPAAGALGPTSTSAIDTTGANFIIIAAGGFNGAGSIVDGLTGCGGPCNTWTPLTVYTNTPLSVGIKLWYCVNPTVGPGHVFEYVNTGGFPALAVAAFNHILTTSPFDVQNGAIPGSGGTTVQPGSITPNHDGELIVAGVFYYGTTTLPTINDGFSITANSVFNGGVSYAFALAYYVQTTAAAINPTWTNSQSQTGYAAAIASFQPAPAATGKCATCDLSRLEYPNSP